MANEEFGNEIWMRSEGTKPSVASDAARAAVGDKTTELGVFAIGLGIIVASLLSFALFLMPTLIRIPATDFSLPTLAVTFAPSLSLVLAGIHVLLSRTTLSVDLAASIVTIAFVGQSLLTMNPFTWIFAAVCLYLIWRTARQAKQQLRSK
jgi:hypothetical protein